MAELIKIFDIRFESRFNEGRLIFSAASMQQAGSTSVFDALNTPLGVLASVVTIAAAIAAAVRSGPPMWRWLQRQRDRRSGESKRSKARDAAAHLIREYHDGRPTLSERQALRLLERARDQFRRGADPLGEGHSLLLIAQARSSVMSRVRDDRRALKAAEDASARLIAAGRPGYAAEAEKLAGFLRTLPRALRNPELARKHYLRAAAYYRQDGFPDDAGEIENNLERYLALGTERSG